MKKRTLVSVVCVLTLLCFGLGLVGCNKHVHTFSDKWSSNSEGHWHAATCEHTQEISDYAEHTYRQNGLCVKCGYDRNSTQGGEEGGEGERNEVVFTTEISQQVELPTDVYVEANNLYLAKIAGGTYQVFGVVDNTVTEIIVPAEHNGVKITSIGISAFADCSKVQRIVLSDNIEEICATACVAQDSSGNTMYCQNLEEVVLGSGLKLIDEQAFMYCNKIRTVNFEDATSLREIGHSAFYECNSLTDVVLPDSLEKIGSGVFFGCIAIEEIIFPEATWSIGYGAFGDCTSLTEVYIPKTVTDIGYSLMAGCTNLETLTMPFVGLDRYDSYYLGLFFDDDLTDGIDPITGNVHVPASLKTVHITNSDELADGAFYGCSNIETLTLPDVLCCVGENVFEGCNDSIFTINENGKYIGNEENPYLVLVDVVDKTVTTFIVNDATTNIAGGAAKNCTSLVEIHISDNLISIGNDAFAGVPTNAFKKSMKSGTAYYLGTTNNPYHALIKAQNSPQTFTFESGVKIVAGGAFLNRTALVDLTIPDGVQSIGSKAFSGCTGLINITIPNSVRAMGDDIFAGATTIKTLTAPAFVLMSIVDSISTIATVNITSGDLIPAYSFYAATSLTTVNMANTVTRIGEYAFYQCNNLTEIKLSTSLKRIDSYGFAGSSLMSIELPEGLEYIDFSAFYYCRYLMGTLVIPDSLEFIGQRAFDTVNVENLYIGSGLRKLGTYAFGHNALLNQITVSPQNKWYYSVDNNMIEIGTGVLHLGSNLSVIPTDGSVTDIAALAFYGRQSIESITLSTHIQSIGYGCFAGAVMLENIYYQGTQAEWNAINKGDSYAYQAGKHQESNAIYVNFSDETKVALDNES